MALYAFDGTGDKDLDGHGGNSNVLEFFRAYDNSPRNDDPSIKVGSLYLKGIGTRSRAFVGDNPAEAFGIGGHRNPLFHSSIPYFCLAWLWRKLGLADVAGTRLDIAFHVGLTLGLASHMVLDIWDYGDVRWIPGDTLGRLWLSGHALLLGLIAWYLQYVLALTAKPRSIP